MALYLLLSRPFIRARWEEISQDPDLPPRYREMTAERFIAECEENEVTVLGFIVKLSDEPLFLAGVKLTRPVGPNPFEYPPGEEPEPVEHEVIGVCDQCGGDAHIIVENPVTRKDEKVCFPCGYHLANWEEPL